MEEYIYNYLTENYFVKTSSIGNDGIYKKNDTRIIETPTDGNKLVNEIITIFDVEKEEVILCVFIWASRIKDGIELEYYWKVHWENEDLKIYDLVFPIIQRVNTSTLALDLVSVQPMSAPKSTLFYMDTVYEEKKKSR